MEFAEVGAFVRGKLREHAYFRKLIVETRQGRANYPWLHEVHFSRNANKNDVEHAAAFLTALLLGEGLVKAKWEKPEATDGFVKSKRDPEVPGFDVYADVRNRRILIWDYTHPQLRGTEKRENGK